MGDRFHTWERRLLWLRVLAVLGVVSTTGLAFWAGRIPALASRPDPERITADAAVPDPQVWRDPIPAPAPPAVVEEPVPEFRVISIIQAGSDYRALVQIPAGGAQRVSRGGQILGWTAEAIDREGIRWRKDARTFTSGIGP